MTSIDGNGIIDIEGERNLPTIRRKLVVKMITESRWISWDELRGICIREELYTKGTNADYDKLYKMCCNNDLSTADIVAMARDIEQHSETYLSVRNICFMIAQKCISIFVDENDY